ncbi:MAG: OmpH family outer membrane protein [Desulfobacterales bacterium]|nr:OmpH family outer membrane protein [Desulfobacterales bacterium]
MKNMLRVISFSTLMVFLFGSVVFAANNKVGYINLQRLVNESKMGKSAREDILKLRREKEKAVVAKQNRINHLRKDLNVNAAKMPLIEKQDKVEALKGLYKEYQRMVADAKEDISREDRELVTLILKKADGVLKKIAKKKKFSIILKDPNAIGYLDPDVDITDLVLKELNKK